MSEDNSLFIDIATQFYRNNAIPLDSTEIFDSLKSAIDYAENNGTAYVGQIITVVESNSISAFQITSEKKLDLILTETNIRSKFSEISTNFGIIENLITDLSNETSVDIYTINNKIKELSGIVDKNIDFIQAISVDLSDDISNILDFNNKISELNGSLDDLSGKHKEDNEELKRDISELSGEYKEDIKDLLSEIQETNDKIFELSGKHKEDIEGISIKITEINSKINNIYSDLSDDISNIVDFNNKISTLNKSFDELSSKHNLEIETLEQEISTLNDTFETFENELSNTVPSNEKDPIFTEWKNSPKIILGKDAKSNNDEDNFIAIGLSASSSKNSIAIGNDAKTNNNASNAIGIKSFADGYKSLAIGSFSKARAEEAVQIGEGVNTATGTLQFKNYPLVDNNGKIFEERIPDQISVNINEISESVNELSTTAFKAISKNTELITNFSDEIELSIDKLNMEIDNISSQHKIDFENLLSKTEDLNNKIESISSEFSNEISDINSNIINIFDELILNTNNINELSDSISNLNTNIDELNDTFETFEKDIEELSSRYETDPIFTEWKNSTEVILGKDAQISDLSGGIAIGLNASSKENSIAIGSDAKVYRKKDSNEGSKGCIALGISAIVSGVNDAVQLGKGTNTSPSSLQFLDWPVINSDGQIHSDRLNTFSDEIIKKYAETMNYTAFEVLTLDEEISAGSKIKSIYNDSGEFSEYNVYNAIPAGYIHTTVLWSYKVSDVSGFNIMIDWGDGTVEMLDDIKLLSVISAGKATYPSNSNLSSTIFNTIEDAFENVFPDTNNNTGSLKEMHPNIPDFNWNGNENVAQAIFISHKYETAGKFIIKIYGTDYFGIAHGTKWNITESVFSYDRVRLSRCFDYDLPIAPHVTSLNCFTGLSNPCLFEVNVPMYYNWVNAKDMAGLFKDKNNLQYVGSRALSNILADSFTNIDIKGIFYKTPNLKYTNIRLPNYSTDLVHGGHKQSLYDYYNWSYCKDNLSIDVLNILPMDKFVDKTVIVGDLFKGFSKISCSDYDKLASYLWNDKTVKWENTASCFTSCSLDLTKIPSTWGGSMLWDDRSDFEIISDMIDADISNIIDLSTNITDINTKLDNTKITIKNISNNLSTTQANVTNISNMLSDIQNNIISNINEVTVYANSISAYADTISNLIDTRLDKMPEITEPTLKELNIPKYVEAGLSQSIPFIVDITQPKFEFGPDINITSVNYSVGAYNISKSYNYDEYKVTTTLPLYKYLDLPALSVGEIIEFWFNADEIYVTDTSVDFLSGAYSKLGYKTVYGIGNPSYVSSKNYHLIARAPYYYGTTNNADISSYSKDLLSAFTKNMVSGLDKFNITTSKYDTNIIIVVPDDYIENVINTQNIYNIEKLQIDPVVINGIKYAFYNIDISTINNSVYCELMLENRISAIFEYDNTYTITGLTPFGKSLSYLEIPKYIDGNAISIVSSLNGTFATDIIIGDHILSVGNGPICGEDGGYNLNNIYISKNITQLNGIGSDNIKNLDLSHTQISSIRVDGKSLSNIIFPEKSLVEIQRYSFENNSALTHLTIPKNVKNFMVGNNPFAFSRDHLTAINFYIDGNLEYIGERVFYKLEHLSSINIPSSVLSIGKNAFYLNKDTDIEFNVLTAINIYQDRETSPLVSQISTWNIVDESIVKFNGEF